MLREELAAPGTDQIAQKAWPCHMGEPQFINLEVADDETFRRDMKNRGSRKASAASGSDVDPQPGGWSWSRRSDRQTGNHLQLFGRPLMPSSGRLDSWILTVFRPGRLLADLAVGHPSAMRSDAPLPVGGPASLSATGGVATAREPWSTKGRAKISPRPTRAAVGEIGPRTCFSR
jgi:hypothetical protein